MLQTYDDFINYINTKKIVPLSKLMDGWKSISELTKRENWHTGIDETDPWRWKDIAAEKRDCAYGCLLGGKKGFVSRDILPIFYSAFKNCMSIDEMYQEGTISKIAYDAWQIILDKGSIPIFDLRYMMGVTKKKGASSLDTALRDLQMMAEVSISGSRQKINKQGIPYGWRSNVYMPFDSWSGKQIINMAKDYEKSEAKDILISIIMENFDVEEGKIKKLFK